MARTKYPMGVAAILRPQKTLSITSNLVLARAENDAQKNTAMPLSVYDTPLARYIVTIIDKSQGETAYPFANIPVNQIPEILKRSDYAFQKHMDHEVGKVDQHSDQQNSPAYTVRFRSGNLKGMSPAEVLLQNGDEGQNILNQQYVYLQKNAEKYPVELSRGSSEKRYLPEQ